MITKDQSVLSQSVAARGSELFEFSKFTKRKCQMSTDECRNQKSKLSLHSVDIEVTASFETWNSHALVDQTDQMQQKRHCTYTCTYTHAHIH